jgi:DNA-directed RNA polymerase subunit H (RpoH/RPB5)
MDEINRFLKSRETVIEMLNDRKYTIPTELKIIKLEQFKILYSKQNLDILCTHREKVNKGKARRAASAANALAAPDLASAGLAVDHVVAVLGEQAVGEAVVRIQACWRRQLGHRRYILSKIYVKYIYADTKGSIIKELISDINKKYLVDNENSIIFIFKSKPSISIVKILTQNKCEYFYLDKLQFNLTKHRLVPNHIILTDDEVSELLDKYKIQLNQLPIIMKEDPVAKYYNYPVGSVYKILRNSHSCIDTDFYRYVK